METPFRGVDFKKYDIITRDKMDQLQTDYQWVYENTPRGRYYKDSGAVAESLLTIICGRSAIKRNKKSDTAMVSVRFGKAFAPTCRPFITTGVVADFQRQIFCTVHGPKAENFPNATGFEISVNIAADNAKQDSIKKDFWVHWSAMGFRTADMNEF